MYLFHFIVGRKKSHSLCTQFAAELKQQFITIAAAFRFCERGRIILVNEKWQWIDKAHNITIAQQISKKFLNNWLNAFKAKKFVW